MPVEISKYSKIILPIIALFACLLAWKLVIRLFSFSPLILPQPYSVLLALSSHINYLLMQAAITLWESVAGFLIGGLAALILAVLFQFYHRLQAAMYPYVIAFKAIPLVALAPIVVVWCGTGSLSKLVLASIISFFPILVTALEGFRSPSPESLDLMSTLSASQWQILCKLRFPNALPYVFAGMKVSATFAVVGSVVAEFVGSQAGIGYVIKSSSYYLDTDLTFAAIIVSAMIGLGFFGGIVLLERAVIFWRPAAQGDSFDRL